MAESLSSEATITTSSKAVLSISTMAAFGDAHDLFTMEPFVSEGVTINFTINVRRAFLEGNYLLHVVETKECSPVAIVCLEYLNPLKIHKVLRKSDMGNYFRLSNYISRYDWMHFRNWLCFGLGHKAFINYLKHTFGKRTYCHLAFFVDANYVSDIDAVAIIIQKENEWIYTILNKDTRPIGFVVDSRKFIGGDWCYGCVLMDKHSGKYFAFLLGDFYYEPQDDLPADQTLIKQDHVNYAFSLEDFI